MSCCSDVGQSFICHNSSQIEISVSIETLQSVLKTAKIVRDCPIQLTGVKMYLSFHSRLRFCWNSVAISRSLEICYPEFDFAAGNQQSHVHRVIYKRRTPVLAACTANIFGASPSCSSASRKHACTHLYGNRRNLRKIQLLFPTETETAQKRATSRSHWWRFRIRTRRHRSQEQSV